MNSIVISISILFICLAFIVTEKNAKYTLSGYNTMTEEERKYVDIKGLIAYFKYFFIFIGVSFLIISLALIHLFDKKIAAIFICIYPIITCFYMVITAKKFHEKS